MQIVKGWAFATDDDAYVDLANEILENAPDEWDDDVAIGFIAVQYVRHLEAEVKRLGGNLYPLGNDGSG